MKRIRVNEDFWIKVASLFLAILIWGAVAARAPRGNLANDPGAALFTGGVVTPEAMRTLPNLPLTVLTAAGDSRGFLVRPETVSVTITGERQSVWGLLPDEVECYANLTDVEEASGLRKQVRVRLPAGLRMERVDPISVEVEIISATKTSTSIIQTNSP